MSEPVGFGLIAELAQDAWRYGWMIYNSNDNGKQVIYASSGGRIKFDNESDLVKWLVNEQYKTTLSEEA